MIEELEREIMMKNTRVRQLQDVVGVFKEEIEEIVGGDLKVVDGIMVELLEVKGKWVEMQRRVEGVKGLRLEVELKERVKEDIIKKINDKVDKQQIEQIEQIEQIANPIITQTLFTATIPHPHLPHHSLPTAQHPTHQPPPPRLPHHNQNPAPKPRTLPSVRLQKTGTMQQQNQISHRYDKRRS
jgi:hypothetical protein